MSVANNRRLKTGPRCLYTMPLAIMDEERADFTSASNVRINTDKTAGEFVETAASLPNPATVAGARDRILRFGGVQGRPTAADPTVYINVEDGTNQAGYTTYGIDATGKKPQKVVGQACVFTVQVSKAPVTGQRVVAGRTGGQVKEFDYATGAAAIAAELAADNWVRAYYLPWRSNHATTMHLGNAADFFLTSTLTGCTFNVYGDRTAPTVTHANNGAQPDLNLSQDYMTRLLAQLAADEPVAANQGAAQGNLASFTTHDYKLKAEPYMMKKQERFLSGDLKLDRAKTHTIVVGYRSASGEWSFFCQQVVNIGYTRTGAKAFFGEKHKKRIMIKQARQIWPAGGGAIIDADLW
ncbi:MAG TPA: hypothetical protein VL308_17605 [Gemmatimonadaceae bacterium]|jgi:hypothetical protein|nr:hypothetical protein [Gemmatimonadaceae bacterium]